MNVYEAPVSMFGWVLLFFKLILIHRYINVLQADRGNKERERGGERERQRERERVRDKDGEIERDREKERGR